MDREIVIYSRGFCTVEGRFHEYSGLFVPFHCESELKQPVEVKNESKMSQKSKIWGYWNVSVMLYTYSNLFWVIMSFGMEYKFFEWEGAVLLNYSDFNSSFWSRALVKIVIQMFALSNKEIFNLNAISFWWK